MLRRKKYLISIIFLILICLSSCQLIISNSEKATKKNYPKEFKEYWGFSLPDKEEKYGYFSIGLGDKCAY